MTKLFMTVTSVLASLGLAGFWPDDPPQPPAPPTAPESPDVVKRVEVRVEGVEEGDAAQALHEAYERLTKLRSERPDLEGRPKEMIERAVGLYRRSVEAFGDEDEGRRAEAQRLAVAARELARAVERLREVQRIDRPDPDLPPPPPIGREVRVRQPHPPIPPELPAGRVAPVPPVPPIPPVPPGAHHESRTIVVRPGVKAESKQFIVVTPEGDVLKDARGKAARKYEVRINQERLRELERQARAQAERATADARKAAGAAARVRSGAIVQGFSIRDRRRGPEQAHSDLQAAYDRIVKAREEFQGKDDARFYLDAARDLYNAARRDIEAGRLDRASELARAAEALTHVPAHLGAIGDAPEGDRPDAVRKRQRFEYRIRRGPEGAEEEVEAREQAEEAEAREQAKEEGDRAAEEKERSDEDKARQEVEIRIEAKEEAAARDEAEAAADSVIGIGAAIGMVDEDVVVLSIVPDGPAAKDGRLKKDDVLVGVIDDDGETTRFAGKELSEIVGALRGPAGTKVKLLVRTGDDEEPETYELYRGKVNIPSGSQVQVDDVDQAVQEAIEQLEGARESARPARPEADRLPPPLPE